MPWVRLDDEFPSHRKVERLTDAAFRLHVQGICWCARNLTDGHISRDDLDFVSRIRRPRRHAAQLVVAGLWSETDSGWYIHDYLEYQPSKAQVERRRENDAERKTRWRKKQSHGVTDGVTDALPESRPDPKPPLPPSQAMGERSSRCKKHQRPRSTCDDCQKPPLAPVPAWCGQCDSPEYRWLDDPPRKCPNCHPSTVRTA